MELEQTNQVHEKYSPAINFMLGIALGTLIGFSTSEVYHEKQHRQRTRQKGLDEKILEQLRYYHHSQQRIEAEVSSHFYNGKSLLLNCIHQNSSFFMRVFPEPPEKLEFLVAQLEEGSKKISFTLGNLSEEPIEWMHQEYSINNGENLYSEKETYMQKHAKNIDILTE